MIVLTSVFAFLTRLVFPIGTGFLNLQFCYFPSYIVMFIAGIIIGENNMLDSVTAGNNIVWIKNSLVIGIPLWCIIMLFGGPLEGRMDINGGFCWQSFAFAAWESLTAIGFSVGLIAFFRKNLNAGGKISLLLSENAFASYVFHAPILISVSLVLKNWATFTIVKFLTVAILACFICLLFSIIIRKVKPLKILFK